MLKFKPLDNRTVLQQFGLDENLVSDCDFHGVGDSYSNSNAVDRTDTSVSTTEIVAQTNSDGMLHLYYLQVEVKYIPRKALDESTLFTE